MWWMVSAAVWLWSWRGSGVDGCGCGGDGDGDVGEGVAVVMVVVSTVTMVVVVVVVTVRSSAVAAFDNYTARRPADGPKARYRRWRPDRSDHTPHTLIYIYIYAHGG